MDEQSARTDVVIVGGGLAGLTAACYLARAGKRVTLFERSSYLGGRAAGQAHDGLWFNRGLHALYTGGPASRVLAELGIHYPHGTPRATFVLRRTMLHAFPAGPLMFLRTRLLRPGDKLELARVVGGVWRTDPWVVARTSVADWIAGATTRAPVRELLTAVAHPFVYSAALDLVSADVFVAKLRRALTHPVHYIDGGWRTLVEALTRTAEALGARLLPGTPVDAVEHHAGRAHGVRLRGGLRVGADAVILATMPSAALRLLDGELVASLRHTIDAHVPARLACLDVALRRLPNPRQPVVFDAEQPRFVSAQSVYARVAPEGAALVAAIKSLDPRHDDDPGADERDLEDLLDTVQPGWRALLVKRVYLPRIEAASLLPLAQNGGFGGRSQPRASGLANLYLAGDGVGAEGFLVDASLARARESARLVLQREPTAPEWREQPALATA